MPALIPMFAMASQLVLVADQVPTLNVDQTCRAAASTGVKGRDTEGCKRDEQTARDSLRQQWNDFGATERDHCVRLSALGGSPSYVELLTCLELAKQSAALPPENKLNDSGTKR